MARKFGGRVPRAARAAIGRPGAVPARRGGETTKGSIHATLPGMSIDVVDLRNFYAQRLGVVARRFVGRGIRKRFADTRGMSVLGVGYSTPYLGLFREEAERCLAFMPAAQ